MLILVNFQGKRPSWNFADKVGNVLDKTLGKTWATNASIKHIHQATEKIHEEHASNW